MKTMYSFLEVLGVLFILCWLFGCSSVDFTKEASYRADTGNGQIYQIKLTPKR
jgi:hypothetical protein